MGIFKNIVKGAIVFGVVGALLALAAPPLASMIGEATLGPAAFAHAMATPVIWTGAFFGAFGAIHAAVAPMLDAVFGKDATPESTTAVKTANCAGRGHALTINNTQIQPDIAVAADVDVNAKANLIDGNDNLVDNKTKLYAEAIEKQRINVPHLQLVK